MSTTVDNRVINLVMNSGDFVKNAEHAANALKKLEAALTLNVKPVGLDSVNTSAKNIATSLNAAAKSAQDCSSKITSSAGQSSQAVAAAAEGIASSVNNSLNQVDAKVEQTFGEKFRSIVGKTASFTGNLLLDTGRKAVGVFTGLTQKIIESGGHILPAIRSILTDITSGIKALVLIAIPSILLISKATGLSAFEIIAHVQNVVKTILSHIPSVTMAVINGISSVIRGATFCFNAIANGVRALSAFLHTAIPSVISAIKQWINSIIPSVVDFANRMKTEIGNAFTSIKTGFSDFAKHISEALDNIKNGLTGFAERVKSKFSKSKSDIEEIGATIEDVGNNIKNVTKDVSDAADAMANSVDGSLSELKSSVENNTDGIGDKAETEINNAEDLFKKAMGDIVGESDKTAGDLKNDADESSSGASDAFGRLRSKVKEVFGDIKDDSENTSDEAESTFGKFAKKAMNLFGLVGEEGAGIGKKLSIGLSVAGPVVMGLVGKLKNAKLANSELKDSMGELGQKIDGVSANVNALSGKFNVLNVVGVSALVNLAKKAEEAGIRLVKSMSVDQVAAGWQKYAQKTKSVGTIMSATGKSIEAVNTQLSKLNWFTDETSYNFTDMTDNIGKFTSNGVELETATTAMEGISLWAALSGQNASTAARAMYNLSQAIGIGSLKLTDWKSIELANMGTKEFKEQVIQVGEELGYLKKINENTWQTTSKTAKAGVEVTVEGFRETLSRSEWISNEVLLGTLSKYGAFTDELSKVSEKTGLTATELLKATEAFDGTAESVADYAEQAAEYGISIDEFLDSLVALSGRDSKAVKDLSKELKINAADIFRMAKAYDGTNESLDEFKDVIKESGFSVDEIVEKIKPLTEDIYELGRRAFKAGQEARSFQDAIDAIKDASSTAFMKIFETIFGNYERATALWTNLAEYLYTMLVDPINSAGDVLSTVLDHPYDVLSKRFENLGIDAEKFKEEALDAINSTRKAGEKFSNFNDALAEGALNATVTAEVLKKLGVEVKTIDDILDGGGLMDIRLFNKNLEELGDNDLTDLIKAMDDIGGRQKLINSAAAALAGLQHGVDFVKTAFSEVFETEGKAVEFLTNLIRFITNLTDILQNGETAKNFFAGLGQSVYKVFEAVKVVTDSIKSVFSSIGEGISETLDKAGGFGFDEISESILMLAKGIKYFVEMLVPGEDTLETIKGSAASVANVFRTLIDIFRKLSQVFVLAMGGIGEGYDVLNVFANPIQTIAKAVEDVVIGIRDWLSEGENFQGLINAFRAVFTVIRSIITVAKSLWKLFGAVIDGAVRLFGRVLGNTVPTALGAVTDIAGIVENVVPDIVEFIDSITEAVKDLFAEGSLLDGIAKFFTKAFGAIGSVFSNFKDITAKGLFDGLIQTLTKFYDTISPLIENVKTLLKDFFGSLSDESTGGEKLSFAGKLLGAISAVVLLVKEGKKVTGIGGLAKKIKNGVDVLTETFEKLGNSLNQIFKAEAFSRTFKVLLTFAVSIALVAAALWVVSTIDVGDIIKAVAAIEIMMFSMVKAAQMLNTGFSEISGKKRPEDMAKPVVGLAAALLIVAISLRVIGSMTVGDVAKSMIAIEVALWSMVAVVKVLSMIDSGGTNVMSQAKAIIIMAAGLLVISMAIKKLSKIKNQENVQAAVFHLVAVLFSLVAAVGVLQKLDTGSGDVMKQAEAIIIMAAALYVISMAVKKLANIENQTNVQNALFYLGGTIAALAFIMLMLKNTGIEGNEALKYTASMAIMAGSLYVVAMAIKKLTRLKDTEKMIYATLAIGGVLAALAFVMLMLKNTGIEGNTALKYTASMAIMAGSLYVVAMAIKKLATIDSSGLVAAVASLGTLMFVFTGVLIAFEKVGVTSTDALKYTASIAIMAGSLYVVTLAIKKLAMLNPDSLFDSVAALGFLLVLFAAILISLDNVGVSTEEALKYTASMAIMAASLVVMAMALKTVAELNPDGLLAGVIALGTLLTEFAVIIGLLNAAGVGIKEALVYAVAMAAMAGALIVVALAIKMIANIDIASLIVSALALGVLFAVLAGSLLILTVTSDAATLLAAAAAILIMAVSIGVIAVSLALLASIDPVGILVGVLAISAVLVVIVALAEVLLYTGAIAAVVLLGASLLMMGVGIAAVGVGAFLFAKAIHEVIDAVILLAEAAPTVINAILLFLDNLGAMIVKVAILIKTGVPLIASAVLSAIFGILTAVNAATVPIGTKIFQIINGILDVLIAYLPQTVFKLGAAFGETILGILAAITVYVPRIKAALGGIFISVVLSMCDVLLILVPTLVAKIGLTILTLITSLAKFISDNSQYYFGAIKSLVESIGVFVIEAISSLPGIGPALTKALQLDEAKATMQEDINANFEAVKNASLAAGQEVVNGISEGASMFTSEGGIVDAVKGLVGGVKDAVGISEEDKSELQEEGKEYPKAVTDGVEQGVEEEKESNFDLGGMLSGTFAEGGDPTSNFDLASMLQTSGSNTANTAAEAMDDPTAQANATEAGKDTTRGFANGIVAPDVMGLLKTKAASMARTAVTAVKEEIDSNSPAKVTMYLGEFFGIGFGNGIQNETDYVADSAEKMAAGAVRSAKDALEYVGDVYDGNVHTATFTPVFEAGDFADSVAGSRKLLTNTVNSVIPKMESANISRTIDISKDEDRIVGAIAGLQTKFESLSNDMKNLKIIMDSGELVGAVTDKVDTSLGVNVTRRRRGN